MFCTICLKKTFLTAVSLILLFPAIAIANPGANTTWLNTITAAYAWQGESDPGERGNFRVNRGVLQFKTARRIGQRGFASVSIGYGEDHYRFDEAPGSFVPWSNIRSLQFALPLLNVDKHTLWTHDADFGVNYALSDDVTNPG